MLASSDGNYVNYRPALRVGHPTSAIPKPSGVLVSFASICVVGENFQGPQVLSTQKLYAQQPYVQQPYVQQTYDQQPYVQQPQIPFLLFQAIRREVPK